ncbi:MAG: hypothetical protein HG453_005535 [Clostridiales bacterium]|jgi:hypothetical protein|nr:hypothetical protein [Clostridiales bacterium]
MINETKYIDTAYETLYILNHCDKEFITKIPIKILNNLKEIAKNSSKKINLLPNKKLKEQNISDETKDFISGLYYTYIADKDEKKEILSIWQQNEQIDKKETTIDIFKNNKPQLQANHLSQQSNIIPYHKETIFDKIKSKIKSLFHK